MQRIRCDDALTGLITREEFHCTRKAPAGPEVSECWPMGHTVCALVMPCTLLSRSALCVMMRLLLSINMDCAMICVILLCNTFFSVTSPHVHSMIGPKAVAPIVIIIIIGLPFSTNTVCFEIESVP